MRGASLVAVAALAGCAPEESPVPLYESAPVTRASIEVSVSSAGIVEPISTVELKSKASGEVLGLFVDVGDDVDENALLVTIDPRTARNRLAQAEAALKAAEARRDIWRTQTERAESLLGKGTLTRADYEQAALELANAESLVVTSRVEVENANIAVDDTQIKAPAAGVVIEKTVERGQVISSPTQDVGGGTLLLKMADLRRMQIRALVDETDVGKVKPGMPATVTVAAYPNQPFHGEVLKIEPQAVEDQTVTMFAALVSIENPEGLLLPGMNAEVEVSIARSDDVLTVPIMALRTARDIAPTAGIIGMDEGELRAMLADDAGTRVAEGGAAPRMAGHGGQGERPAAPAAGAGQVVRRGPSAGGGPRQGERRTDYRFGGDFWVVLDTVGGPRPVNVRAGITDLERVEVIAGLEESDRVLLLPSAHLLETQEQLQNFINRRIGGVPGIAGR